MAHKFVVLYTPASSPQKTEGLDELNKLTSEGWLPVAVHPMTAIPGAGGGAGQSHSSGGVAALVQVKKSDSA